MKRYRDAKAKAKEHFRNIGGYDNLEHVRNNPTDGMGHDNWGKTVDYFCTQEHKNRSEVNKFNRQKQKYVNHRGTSSHSSWAFKKVMIYIYKCVFNI